MKITLLGTGTSLPDPERVQSGVLVEAGGITMLLDIGSGVLQRMTQSGVDLTAIEHVFISHFHIDHCSDFLSFCQSLWLLGYDRTLKLYAPPRMREWSRGIYDIAFPYLREKLLVEKRVLEEDDVVHLGPVVVSTAPTTHSTLESRAFRVEHEGKSVVYSSDTAPCREVMELATGADILIHECNWLDGDYPKGVHTSPSELAEIVELAGPRKVVITHISPEVVADEKRVLTTVGRRTDGEVVIGKDLMTLTL
ncbi:MAG: MBL fold metallo-hydrolase [Candidatus Thorarchaeota archaeon]|jgi:ribonuclease BN (tRNA processing enzyme)